MYQASVIQFKEYDSTRPMGDHLCYKSLSLATIYTQYTFISLDGTIIAIGLKQHNGGRGLSYRYRPATRDTSEGVKIRDKCSYYF